ncbi:MAG: 3-deoxy-8-phosphooctulonate synthase [Sporomusaceae bacterium]|jgi:2-dehydro-3-deoxyphosphooctonate aldolase (KDO 8-P synthase)|nr:3-deoxy-8-phosphooctulonate synthase [Sporomusaceae bacterium]
MQIVKINEIPVGGQNPLVLFAGPCVLEEEERVLKIGQTIKEITTRLGIPYIFKASYDKANRTSYQSFRGPGLQEGLAMLSRLKKALNVPIISDVHSVTEIEPAAEVLDVIQIPAFLCRQTDLVYQAGQTGKPVNVKKGQFLAPLDMKNVIAKLEESGNHNILLTERGASFGYNNLVVDFRSFPLLRSLGYPVVFDATHSVQLPGGAGTSSSGQREFVPPLARSAAAAGIDALFLEVHDDPPAAKSDGANMVYLDKLEDLLKDILAIDNTIRKHK